MAFTWQKLKEKYDKKIISKPEKLKKFYEQCFLVFEGIVLEHFPNAIKNPKIILNNDVKLNELCRNYEFPRKYLYSIRLIISILSDAYTRKYDPSKSRADRKTFSIIETGACFEGWLKNTGWEIFGSYYYLFSAKRKKEEMVIELMESQRKNKNKSSFFQTAGHCMINLLEKKHNNAKLIPAIAFPDDESTIKAILPLIQYFNKFKIKLYAVKSVGLVRQL